jgi:hypothetical protein
MSGKSRRSGSSMEIGGTRSIRGGSGALDRETQIKIGQQLRAMYDEIVRQGVPERFADLLNRLERQEEQEAQSPGHLEQQQEDEEPKP